MEGYATCSNVPGSHCNTTGCVVHLKLPSCFILPAAMSQGPTATPLDVSYTSSFPAVFPGTRNPVIIGSHVYIFPYKIALVLKPDFNLKGQGVTRFFASGFHESSSFKPLKIRLGSFQILSKIRGDIRKSNLPLVLTTLAANFATGFAGVVETSGKFATGVNYTGSKIMGKISE